MPTHIDRLHHCNACDYVFRAMAVAVPEGLRESDRSELAWLISAIVERKMTAGVRKGVLSKC